MELYLPLTMIMLAYLSMGVTSAYSNPPNPLDLIEEFYPSNTSDENEVAKTFLTNFNKKADELMHISKLKSWAYETDLTEKNLQEKVEADLKVAEFFLEAKNDASSIKTNDLSPDFKRQIYLIGTSTCDSTSNEMRQKLRKALDKLTNIPQIIKDSKKYSLSDLEEIMSTSRVRKTLDWAWESWRHAAGKRKQSLYSSVIEMLNIGARENGWTDYGDYSRSGYEMGNDFESSLDDVWKKIEPLYKELHAYVRYRLRSVYKIKESGKIPASLLGDMFAQKWENIYPLVKPTKTSRAFDVTKTLKKQKYTVAKMFFEASSFIISLGLDPAPFVFWKESVFTKPSDKEMNCNASAWDFSKGEVRIKMCAKIKHKDFFTIQHLFGPITYFVAYQAQPYIFRTGANPGFHEAVGGLITLSAENPIHLREIGLLDKSTLSSDDAISFLLKKALSLIAPLPYILLLEKWRWKVYRGKIPKIHYNREWWKMRGKYQGVEPPVRRRQHDFDPASSFHVIANKHYASHFVGYVLQFQLHQQFCKVAKSKLPLHLCSIYKSKEAGKYLRLMMKKGRSKRWQQILKEATYGKQTELSADSMLEYFQPLHDWLKSYREKKKYPLGWDESFSEPICYRKKNKKKRCRKKFGKETS